MVPVIGLMITRNDEGVIREWLEANVRFLDGLVLLDGSPPQAGMTATGKIIDEFKADCPGRSLDIHYLHESDPEVIGRLTLNPVTGQPQSQQQRAEAQRAAEAAQARQAAQADKASRAALMGTAEVFRGSADAALLAESARRSAQVLANAGGGAQGSGVVVKNDQTLRAVVHEKIRELYGHGRWIVLCHSDEFFYHDPRRIAAVASAASADHVFWYALHVLPHPSEQERYDRGGKEPLVQMRFQHFHHNYRNKGHPWMEVS